MEGMDTRGIIGTNLASFLDNGIAPPAGGWAHDDVAVVSPAAGAPVSNIDKIATFPPSRIVRMPSVPPAAVEAHAIALLRGQLLHLLAEVDAGRVTQLGCVFSRPDGIWEEAITMRSDGTQSMVGAFTIAACRLSQVQVASSLPVAAPPPA